MYLLYVKLPLGQNGCTIRFDLRSSLPLLFNLHELDHQLIVNAVVQVISNLIYFYGMCGLIKERLLQRYFSKVAFAILFFMFLSLCHDTNAHDFLFVYVGRKFVAMHKSLSQILCRAAEM